jgi:hypothetical protein
MALKYMFNGGSTQQLSSPCFLDSKYSELTAIKMDDVDLSKIISPKLVAGQLEGRLRQIDQEGNKVTRLIDKFHHIQREADKKSVEKEAKALVDGPVIRKTPMIVNGRKLSVETANMDDKAYLMLKDQEVSG